MVLGESCQDARQRFHYKVPEESRRKVQMKVHTSTSQSSKLPRPKNGPGITEHFQFLNSAQRKVFEEGVLQCGVWHVLGFWPGLATSEVEKFEACANHRTNS